MKRIRNVAGGLLVLLCSVVRADDLWTARAGHIDVTTAAGRDRAVALARDLERFDLVLARILRLAEAHVPTHVYELTAKQAMELFGSEHRVAYHFSGYEVTVAMGPPPDRGNRNWGPYFGYTGSVLVSGRLLRTPYWFLIGVPELFANTEFDGSSVKTGGADARYINSLSRSSLIPSIELLRLQSGDPQLASGKYMQLVQAQSWYVAHEVLVEGKLRAEFARYLDQIGRGKSEAAAFSESFSIGYGELDKILSHALGAPAHAFALEVPAAPAGDLQAIRLSAADAGARVAALNLLWHRRAEASKYAAEAARVDAASDLALSVLARAAVEDARYSDALAAVDRLGALQARSAAALTDGAAVLRDLAKEASSQHASLGVDAAQLGRRAQEWYEQAIEQDPEYLRAWAGLANVLADRHDVESAHALLVRAQPVFERHTYCSALARALTIMAATTGQRPGAFLFAEYWRNSAVDQRELDEAVAFAAKLPATLEATSTPLY